MSDGQVVIIGGSSGIGRELATSYADEGREVVLTSRDADRAASVAAEIGGSTRGLALDLARPEELADRLADVGAVDHLLAVAIDRDENTVPDFDVERARHLVTLKLVGYAEVVHVLLDRMNDDSSVVMFGGLARDRPYPGSTTVTTVNGGVTGLVHTMAVELAPIRVNAIHPAIVGDSPYWADKPADVLDGFRERTPMGQLVRMADVVGACRFLLSNPSVTGVNLRIDGGWMLA